MGFNWAFKGLRAIIRVQSLPSRDAVVTAKLQVLLWIFAVYVEVNHKN
jgi:hypothetical protein